MFKSISKAAIYKVITMLLVLSTTGLVIRSLGAEGYVLYASITSFLGFLALIDFGLGNSCRNALGDSYSQDKMAQYNETINLNYVINSKLNS